MLKRDEEVLFDAVRAAQHAIDRFDSCKDNACEAAENVRVAICNPVIRAITARIGERHD